MKAPADYVAASRSVRRKHDKNGQPLTNYEKFINRRADKKLVSAWIDQSRIARHLLAMKKVGMKQLSSYLQWCLDEKTDEILGG